MVSDSGSGLIDGSTLEYVSRPNENVNFGTAAGGTLRLDQGVGSAERSRLLRQETIVLVNLTGKSSAAIYETQPANSPSATDHTAHEERSAGSRKNVVCCLRRNGGGMAVTVEVAPVTDLNGNAAGNNLNCFVHRQTPVF